jgi:hypothetical protein
MHPLISDTPGYQAGRTKLAVKLAVGLQITGALAMLYQSDVLADAGSGLGRHSRWAVERCSGVRMANA